MNQYLIPANSKRSMLILGLFEKIDLMIFGVGIGLMFFLLLILPHETMQDLLVIFTPFIICGAMVLPVPNHRNMWQLTAHVYQFYTNRRRYYWRGWCVNYVEETNEERSK